MPIYLDTGCLLKLYYLEVNSGAVINAVADEAIIFTELHELEIAAALHSKCFRGEASQQQVEAAMNMVAIDLADGKIIRPIILWHKALKTAAILAQSLFGDDWLPLIGPSALCFGSNHQSNPIYFF